MHDVSVAEDMLLEYRDSRTIFFLGENGMFFTDKGCPLDYRSVAQALLHITDAQVEQFPHGYILPGKVLCYCAEEMLGFCTQPRVLNTIINQYVKLYGTDVKCLHLYGYVKEWNKGPLLIGQAFIIDKQQSEE